jgi:hypothetical protein
MNWPHCRTCNQPFDLLCQNYREDCEPVTDPATQATPAPVSEAELDEMTELVHDYKRRMTSASYVRPAWLAGDAMHCAMLAETAIATAREYHAQLAASAGLVAAAREWVVACDANDAAQSQRSMLEFPDTQTASAVVQAVKRLDRAARALAVHPAESEAQRV